MRPRPGKCQTRSLMAVHRAIKARCCAAAGSVVNWIGNKSEMKQICARLVATILLIVASTSSAQERVAVKGSLVIMGGAVHPDTEEIWQRIVSLSGGPGASIAVIAAAAASPESSARRTIETLERYGAKPFFVTAAPRLAGRDFRRDAQDPDIARAVERAGGVFLTGGDQSRITQTLLRQDGQATALLTAINHLYERGGVIAGTSAGAAVMSRTMFYEPPDVLRLLQEGLAPGRDIAPGLGFVGEEVFVDQHVLARGRFARMLPAMAAAKVTYGVGIDENTALVVTAKRNAEVIGASGVVVIDTSKTTRDADEPRFNLRGARVSYLERGDLIDLAKRTIVASPFKMKGTVLNHSDVNFKPEFDEARWYPDVLGKNLLIEILCNLVDNRLKEVSGLALPSPAHADRRTGFEFVFRKGADTRGFLRIEKSRAHYSVTDVELDVTPVEVASPLYRRR
ncbi:MAG: cyanophycinase [Betaproteobacteria bacterium]|nr:MAG: cyanophycinase [Betaproteobacteria bacterium]